MLLMMKRVICVVVVIAISGCIKSCPFSGVTTYERCVFKEVLIIVVFTPSC